MTRRAVILAGGRGTRLAPYTTVLPKPLLPVGDRAILDVVVRQLCQAGIDRLTIAVGHLAHLIEAVFGDGKRHGVHIEYEVESEPRGTAGPLATIAGLDETFLMLNGDVLTTLDFRELIRAHHAAGNALTIATHRREVFIDYGVLHADGTDRVVAYDEKPTLSYTVSMGVYVLEPGTRDYVPRDVPFDFPDLVQALLAAGERVGSLLYDGYWLDIGRHDDYERAIAEFEGLLPQLLPADGPDASDR
ncbi:MAG TPA: sugar phosphate nucleotidyltransferase [Solirubrobacteraceae bacterium]